MLLPFTLLQRRGCGRLPPLHHRTAPVAPTRSPARSPRPPPPLRVAAARRRSHVHSYNIEYMRRFMAAYDDAAPWFLTNTFLEGHEGTGEVLRTVDGDLAAFLADLRPEQLRDTAVVLVSDHGLHMGLNFVYSANGRVEHMNPFLAMLLPAWVADKYPHIAAALNDAQQRLVTPFDIFATLNQLLHFDGDKQRTPADVEASFPDWSAAGRYSPDVKWTASLLSGIPASRTCEQAMVPDGGCRCYPDGEEGADLFGDMP